MPRAQERVEAWVNEESPGHRADLAAGFATGSLLGGYRLEEQVGAGGMAVVFRARDERLNRLVALKIMTPAMGSDDMFRQRFIRESRAAAAVDDPHIIPVYEAGEVGQVLFIAMRFVQGGDVRSLLRREGPLSPERVASIVSPVASALDAAHAVGLVHRDVKPANILLDRRPGRPEHVYLSDFGLSKSAEVSLGLTAAGQFLGTPDYTAPEQIEGLPVDGRTDQYALACAVFELLTGQAPFHRSESFAAIWAHLNKPPPSLTERRPELSPAVNAVMAKALAKPQVDRYPTCWEFADALRDALGLESYRLGSSSDPGLSRTGPSGVAVSQSPVASPPGPPVLEPAAGADEAVPPPGQDTEASEVYAARPLAVDWHPGRPAAQDEPDTPDDQATDPGHPASPEDRPASPEDSAGDQDDDGPTSPRPTAGPPRRTAGPPPGRPAPPRDALGGPGQRPNVLRTPPRRTRRGRRPGRRRATLLTLIGAGVLATAGAAVVLTMVLNTILVPAPAHREISPSAWSRIYGPPQVAGILSAVAFSPDGKMLAAGASGGQKSGSQAKGATYLLNVRTGNLTKTLYSGGGAEAFSPSGMLLAAAGGPHNSVTCLWNADTGDKIATLNDHAGSSVDSVSFSPDGKMLATNDRNGVVYLWRLPRGPRTTSVSRPGTVSPPGPNLDAVAFSPRGTTLAMGGSNGQVYLFNTNTDSTSSLSTPDGASITSVAFSHGGALLAASEMGGVTYVWNRDNHSRISLDDPDGAIIESVAFSTNGEWLATGDANGNIYLWNLTAKKNKNKPARSLVNPKNGTAASPAGDAVFSLAFGPVSNTLATTDTNGHVYLWRVR
jgi:serine/threonine protein kinase